MNEQEKWEVENFDPAYKLQQGSNYVFIFDGVSEIARCGFAGYKDKAIGLREATKRARLIAAAPELLACCKSMLREMTAIDGAYAGTDVSLWRDALQDAIAKVEGRTE